MTTIQNSYVFLKNRLLEPIKTCREEPQLDSNTGEVQTDPKHFYIPNSWWRNQTYRLRLEGGNDVGVGPLTLPQVFWCGGQTSFLSKLTLWTYYKKTENEGKVGAIQQINYNDKWWAPNWLGNWLVGIWNPSLFTKMAMFPMKRTSVSLAADIIDIFKSVLNGEVGGMVQTSWKRLLLLLTSRVQASPCDMLPFGQNWEPLQKQFEANRSSTWESNSRNHWSWQESPNTSWGIQRNGWILIASRKRISFLSAFKDMLANVSTNVAPSPSS